MCGGDGVFLEQTGHEGTQPHPEDLCPRAVAVPEHGGQGIQGSCNPRGGRGAQGLFNVAHDPLGTRRPVAGLRTRVSLGVALHGQAQDVRQQLPGCRGHEQAGIFLQGEDGVQDAWGGRAEKTGFSGGLQGGYTAGQP